LLLPQRMPTTINAQGNAASSSRMGTALFGLACALLALGIWFWSTRGTRPESSAGQGSQVKSTLHLESFVLNLADPGQRSYLRVGIDLGLSRQMGRGENAPLGPVRDTILSVLGQSQADDLVTAKGKTNLKEHLLHGLQERVPDLGVEEVYFTEFLIQR
jgi:flagellar basal body-associated protein FliL